MENISAIKVVSIYSDMLTETYDHTLAVDRKLGEIKNRYPVNT